MYLILLGFTYYVAFANNLLAVHSVFVINKMQIDQSSNVESSSRFTRQLLQYSHRDCSFYVTYLVLKTNLDVSMLLLFLELLLQCKIGIQDN